MVLPTTDVMLETRNTYAPDVGRYVRLNTMLADLRRTFSVPTLLVSNVVDFCSGLRKMKSKEACNYLKAPLEAKEDIW